MSVISSSRRYFAVALLARAWIEITKSFTEHGIVIGSLSLRERGLKLWQHWRDFNGENVALLARAWIEISLASRLALTVHVALLARAWIEIFISPYARDSR